MRKATLLRLLVIVLATAALEAACRGGLISKFAMIAPSEMVVALIGIFRTPAMMHEIYMSLLNIGAAILLSVVIGFIIGLAIHAVPRVRRVIDPLLSSYYAIPLFAFYPLFIVMFGVGRLPIILMGFFTSVAAMVLATLNGLDSIPRVLNKVSLTYQMSPVATALKLKLPAAAPYIFSGIKLAIAYSFIGVIASEFILSGEGLGFQVGFTFNAFDTRTMYGLILLIVLLASALNTILHIWDQRLQLRRRRYGA